MRTGVTTALLVSATLWGASSAAADSTLSSNWAGYAIHRHGVSFHKVFAAWRQPGASCPPGHDGFSAFWVGLGGYRLTSRSLEQVGTEVDCKPSGKVVSTAWFELVPSASRVIRIPVRPGDLIEASVAATGHRVTVRMYDATQRRLFKKTVYARSVDVSSADWIVEAPSACLGLFLCQTLPLTDFGSTTFANARAQSRSGHIGSISDPRWRSTMVTLAPGGRRFVAYQGSGPAFGAAVPSPLRVGGTVFDVNYLKVSVQQAQRERSLRAALASGQLMHPGR